MHTHIGREKREEKEKVEKHIWNQRRRVKWSSHGWSDSVTNLAPKRGHVVTDLLRMDVAGAKGRDPKDMHKKPTKINRI